MVKVKRYVLLFDLHYPEIHQRSWNAVLRFIDQTKPDGCIIAGDFLDNQSVSHHTKGKPGQKEPGGYAKDLNGFREDILIPLTSALPKSADKRVILGNHEDWLQDLYDEMPELQGSLDIGEWLKFKQLGWKELSLGAITTIGKLHVLHGENFTGQAAAKKLVETLCQSAVMGHLHTLQAYTKTAPIGKKKWVGYVIPTLGTVDPKYAKKKPNSSIHGFAVVEVWAGGNFNLYPVVITEGQFAYGGTLYDAG